MSANISSKIGSAVECWRERKIGPARRWKAESADTWGRGNVTAGIRSDGVPSLGLAARSLQEYPAHPDAEPAAHVWNGSSQRGLRMWCQQTAARWSLQLSAGGSDL